MPEGSQSVGRSDGHLSHSVYWKIKRALSFRRRVFGQRLEETVLYERRYGDHVVPLVVEQCVGFIRQRGLLEVGLFRQPGQATQVKELQEAFDTGEKPSFNSSTDVHTVASLLKLYLRELPEPVVPFSLYQDFLLCGKMIHTERKEGLAELKRLLQELPVANFNLLHYICQFLYEVQSFSSYNKMSTQNLATVFGPNILRPKAEDPESIMGGASAVQQLMAELISEHSVLFLSDGEADALHSQGPTRKGVAEPAAPLPHSYLEPACGGHPEHCWATQFPQSSPCLTTPESQALDTPSPMDFGDLACDDTCPPPCDNTSAGTGAPPPTAVPHVTSSEVPTPTPVPEGSGRSTAVAGMQEGPMDPRHGGFSRDRHRSAGAYNSTLSVYDNVDMAGRASSAPPLDTTEDRLTSTLSSPWSSCEIILQDEGASRDPQGSRSPSSRDEAEVRSATSSALTDTILSSGSSEVFLPCLSPQASNAMQSLLTGLRQQMARQRVQYEARIKSLEQRNQALQEEVQGLQSSLEQQRHRYSVAEMRMRNAERARTDADRRNAALQHEMEQFFDTFGELDFEAKRTERILKSF